MDAAGKRLWDLECKIIGTPARSQASLIAKAQRGREAGDEERFGGGVDRRSARAWGEDTAGRVLK